MIVCDERPVLRIRVTPEYSRVGLLRRLPRPCPATGSWVFFNSRGLFTQARVSCRVHIHVSSLSDIFVAHTPGGLTLSPRWTSILPVFPPKAARELRYSLVLEVGAAPVGPSK